MKIIRLIALILCIVVAASVLFGCAASYEIATENGAMYLELHHVGRPDRSVGAVILGLGFESVEELCERVTSYALTEQELDYINDSFGKDEDGRVPILNMDTLQRPSVPGDMIAQESLKWYGDFYELRLDTDESYPTEASGAFTYCSKSEWETRKKWAYSIGEDTFKPSYEFTDGKKIVKYSAGQSTFMQIEYTLKDGDTTRYILEEYRLKTTGDSPCSDTIPYQVHIFGVTGDHYYIYSFDDLGVHPSVEWLSSFGVKDVTVDQ